MFQQVLPFDDAYAWERLVGVLKLQTKGERFVFYGLGKKITFTREANMKVGITTDSMSFGLTKPSFEVTFMAAVLKDAHRHLHIYEKSATRNKDWKLQIYRCADPDCRHYEPAEKIIGKRARCHECKTEMIIDRSQIKNKIIVGMCCAKSMAAIKFRAAKVAINDVLAQAGISETTEATELTSVDAETQDNAPIETIEYPRWNS